MYESPDKSYLEQPQELTDVVDSTKLIHKYLPKQVDIDRIMGIIKRKVLKGSHLPLTIKGQTLVFIQIEIMVIHITVLLVNIIHPVPLGISLTQVIIKQIP